MSSIQNEEGAASLQPAVPLKQDPSRLELRAKPRPVTRLNRKTVAIIAGTAVTCTLLAILWGLRPAKPRNVEQPEVRRAPERITRAPGLATLPRDYASIPRPRPSDVPQIPELGPPLGEFGQPIGRNRQNALAGPAQGVLRRTSSSASRRTSPSDQYASDEVAGSAIFFQLNDRRDAHRFPFQHADSSRMVATAAGVPPGPGDRTQAMAPNLTPGALRIESEKPEQSIYASGAVQTPRSPRQLMAGTLIRAALVTGINSDLPGQIIATVVENVFDSATGTQLLIPQGSRLLGEYSEEGTYGQRRVLVTWARLIRPDNSSIILDSLPGTDASGYAGLEDQVDEHFKRVLGGAAVSTLLGIGTELASPRRSDAGGAVIIAARDSAHDILNDAGQQISRRSLDIRPTRTIRPGFPVHVIINKDLIL